MGAGGNGKGRQEKVSRDSAGENPAGHFGLKAVSRALNGSVPANGDMDQPGLASVATARSHSVTPFNNCCFSRFSSTSGLAFTQRTARVSPRIPPHP